MTTYIRDALDVLGGNIKNTDAELDRLLRHWTFLFATDHYLLVETYSRGISFGSGTFPENPKDVMRLHAFGKKGDLTIRRDDEAIYWRYVGVRVQRPIPESAKDYWDTSGTNGLISETVDVLLWGEYGQSKNPAYAHHWHENRVGKATPTLKYQFPNVEQAMDARQNGQKKVMVQTQVIRHPQTRTVVAFWNIGLVPYEPLKEKSNE